MMHSRSTQEGEASIFRVPCHCVFAALLVVLNGGTSVSDDFANEGASGAKRVGNATIYSVPADEELSADFQVTVDGHDVPVYRAKVAPADAEKRWKAMDDKRNSADYFDTAAFASFDWHDAVTVTVSAQEEVLSAMILPTSAGITPNVLGKTVTFPVTAPANLTIEINGETVRSLHLFVNPVEKNVPDPNDPNVIFFGPGIHKLSHLIVHDNQTLYVAGGAIIRAVVSPDEPFTVNATTGLRNYAPTIELRGNNIRLSGRGIIDASACMTHARNLVLVDGSDITVSGVILRDASTWNMPIRRSDRVRVHDVKIIGYRANSDGVDVCNSRNVTIEDCFIRTLDDLVVVKTDRGQGVANRVLVQRCVLWNQVAHALSVGAEIREDISDILFTDCDVIHDRGREWTLRIFHSDAAKVSDVRFEDIRIEESRKLASLWIGKSMWSDDSQYGRIENVIFKGIHAAGTPLTIELVCQDEEHNIENVLFQDVLLNREHLRRPHIDASEFVENLIVKP